VSSFLIAYISSESSVPETKKAPSVNLPDHEVHTFGSAPLLKRNRQVSGRAYIAAYYPLISSLILNSARIPTWRGVLPSGSISNGEASPVSNSFCRPATSPDML
jgi:hypothetical protein